jgi:osmoprotectant transport system permease protein
MKNVLREGWPRLVPAALALAALGLGGDWLSLAPNRLLPGAPRPAFVVLPGWAFLAMPLLLAALPARRWAGASAAMAALVLLAASGMAATSLLEGQASAARATLGSAAWVGLSAALALALWPVGAGADRQGRGRVPAAMLLGGGLVALVLSGALDGLSLMVEYHARQAAVHDAFLRHLWLSLLALVLAFLLALTFTLAGLASRRLAVGLDTLLGAVQVVPAIAMFGLLVPALALLLAAWPGLRGLGLGAIGPTPALIGVALYLALPLLRALRTGLTATDPAVVRAAIALGMGPWRVLAWVRAPLGVPHLVGGLRVATVQSIGLITLGGLVGAGGLGALVFEGMSQFAADLILLGALPVVALALAADAALAHAAPTAPEGATPEGARA